MENNDKKRIVVGVFAHVDAGKTSLIENILFEGGSLRKTGRVDHKNSFLDTGVQERARGMTILSKQAIIRTRSAVMTLVDTPGHMDFSGEMERTIGVIDYGILVISGSEGIDGHTKLLWKLLKANHLPVFLFVNKMDISHKSETRIMEELTEIFGEGCVLMRGTALEESALEKAALSDDRALEEYMETGTLGEDTVKRLIHKRDIFPCYFGSALRQQGVKSLLEGIILYTEMRDESLSQDFSGIVQKITADSQGIRLTHIRVRRGVLRVKDFLETGHDMDGGEKIHQIRLYSGEKFDVVQEVPSGMICAVTGPKLTFAGQLLGQMQERRKRKMIAPVMKYRIFPKDREKVRELMEKLDILNQEDPLLDARWEGELEEISVCLMGKIQAETLKETIKDRFHIEVCFENGRVLYRETIRNQVEGVGHFEPLRHYAEVHLILEPLARGRGILFENHCRTNLEDNWQKLILTHLREKTHKGVLIGAPLTDIRISLAAGKGHIRHTEGGDFREAVYRAVRQGLMQAECDLLEPYFDYEIDIPAAYTGKVMTDIKKMNGEVGEPRQREDRVLLYGRLPVSEMGDYPVELTGYTKGEGSMITSFGGYDLCKNQEEIVQSLNYDPEKDPENVSGSIFCRKGAGEYVPWYEVHSRMHLEGVLKEIKEDPESSGSLPGKKGDVNRLLDKELEDIFFKTYGHTSSFQKTRIRNGTGEKKQKAFRENEEPAGEEILMVDGYNIIHSWEELKSLAGDSIEAARGRLLDIMSNYQGFKRCHVIVVFDAYNVEGHETEIQKYHNIHVIYTKDQETADQYIEKTVNFAGKKYRVTIATSDRVEQVIAMARGGTILSARGLLEEVESAGREEKEKMDRGKKLAKERIYLFDHAEEEIAVRMEEIRLGREES